MDIFSPLSIATEWLLYDVLAVRDNSPLGVSLHFFIYDSLKILIMLLIINYCMAVVRHYLPLERMRGFLASRRWYGMDHAIAALFGALTPFCSCSSIPLFVGFIGAGIPLGVTFSFLITSPLINEAAIVLFIGLFGWKITLAYTLAGISIGVLGGILIGAMKMERFVEPFVFATQIKALQQKKVVLTPYQLHLQFIKQTKEITKPLLPYVLAGIAVGSIIHGYVPSGFFEQFITKENLFAVPIAVLIGVPLYSNATGVIPVVQALIAKGIPLGTALSLMMAVVGLSIPEALILKKVIKIPLLITFFSVVTVGIIIIGYVFNAGMK